MRKEFFGTMTVENAEQIMNMIYDVLNGHEYVFCSVNEGYNFSSSVDTRKSHLDGDPHIWYADDNSYCGFNFNDDRYVWGLSTSQTERGYDSNFDAPYVVIEWNKIKITHRAPAGHLLHWQIIVIDND